MCSKSHWRERKHENPAEVAVVRLAPGQCKEHPSPYRISVLSSTSTWFHAQCMLLSPPFALQDPANMYGLPYIDAQTVDSIYLYESVLYNSCQMKCKLYFHNLLVSRIFSGPDKHRFWIARLFHWLFHQNVSIHAAVFAPSAAVLTFVRHRVPVSPPRSPGIP